MSKNRKRRKRAKAMGPKKTKQVTNQSFTINADEIEKAILAEAGAHKETIERVVVAGMKVLFSNETHEKIFSSIRPDDQVPLQDELGSATANLMKLLYNESKQTMPGEAIYPAGTILLARAAEFINRTKLAPITDDDFYEALAMFDSVLKREINSAPPQGPAQQPAPNPIPQQPQGMLNGG